MKEKIATYIIEELINSQEALNLSYDDDLLNEGLLDSLSIMKLISYLEKEFEVSVAPSDMTIENFITIDAISDYLERIK